MTTISPKTTVTASDGRAPVRWATYRRNVFAYVAGMMRDRVPMGPSTMGEWLWPVRVEHDANSNRTRVGFSYVEPPVHRVDISDRLDLTNARLTWVPDIADPTAPTLAELDEGVDLTTYLEGPS